MPGLQMPYLHLRLGIPHPQVNHVPNLHWPFFGSVLECMQSQPNAVQFNYHIFFAKNRYTSFPFFSSFARIQAVGALQISVDAREESYADKYSQIKIGVKSYEEHTFDEEVQLDSYTGCAEISANENHKESERRRKIGHANKGKVPWNKGRKHSAGTRERIKQRTIEALRDPKVRKKMSECPRAHSNQSKARIRSSLRRVWGKRLNFPRLREKFVLSWAVRIAKAAKKGASDQEGLDWDSYDKQKEEIACQKLQQAADKAKAKQMAKLKAERAAQAKADKMARLTQKEWEEKTKARGKIGRKTYKKSREEKEELAAAQELKLKERLTKIHKKKSSNISKQVETVDSKILAWEKLDLESVRRKKMLSEISLSDQIRAAKNKRIGTAAS